ncbi:MAG: RluA family pseudouridine synthase [Kiritimatiellae bacterium]|nr:RluA family pseudouridine synthase [Kiritimatiellia bacterium]
MTDEDEEEELEELEEAGGEIRTVALPEGGIGERLDLWLAERLPDLSRARLQALLKEGAVTLDGRPAKATARPKTAGTVRIVLPPPVPALPQPEEIPLEILYEDADCLVINKPAGLVVHPAPGHPTGTLVNALLFHCRDLRGIGGVERPGIVHRLDKDTSGLMVVAKSDAAMAGFVHLFQTGGIRKEYLAWVHGRPPHETGTVSTLIGRHPEHRQKMAVVTRNGKPAVTHYRIEREAGPITLLRCRIETGRTHQIRVHTRYLGCPIVGDPVYGRPAADRLLDPVPTRQLLHAERLTFTHPLTHAPMTFTAPPPGDFY